jgi:hypothetical protein
MNKNELIKALNKAHNIIMSCENFEHILVAENYVSNFSEIYNNEEIINKLKIKLDEKKQKLKPI